MEIKVNNDLIDITLTPENAESRGYRIIEDVTYEIFSPVGNSFGIFELIHKFGFKLGLPNNMDKEKFLGLYMPQ